MEELSERKRKILRAVVESYVEKAEPVGSKTLSVISELRVSSATIRNEMSELEELGFLEQPHTSAGRIPSAKGYRFYVNELMEEHKLSMEETRQIQDALKLRLTELEQVIETAGQVASKMTRYPTIALLPASEQITVKRFDVLKVEEHSFIIVLLLSNSAVRNRLVRFPQRITEEQLRAVNTLLNQTFSNLTIEQITPELMGIAQNAANGAYGLISLVISFAIEMMQEMQRPMMSTYGVQNLFNQPEFRDMEKAEPMMHYLAEEYMENNFPVPKSEEKNRILIGPENVIEVLKDSSVIMASYDIGDGMQGIIGVIGPTRMDYAKLSARMEYFAYTMTRLLNGTPESLHEGRDKYYKKE